MISKELAVKAFTLVGGVSKEGMRYAIDCFGGHFSCLWRNDGAMVEGTVHPVLGEDNALMVCIRARAEVKLFAMSAELFPRWYKVVDVDSDDPIVEEMKGFELSIG